MPKVAIAALLFLSHLLVAPAQAGEIVVDVHRSVNRVIIVNPPALPPPPSVQRHVVVIDHGDEDCRLHTVTVRVGNNYIKRRVWSCF